MAPDKNDLHPEMWMSEPTALKSAPLMPEEEIRMAMCLEVLNGTEKVYNVFLVVETPTDIRARIVLTNSTSSRLDGYEMASYPKSDLESLVNEVRNKVLGFAEFIMNLQPAKMSIDTNVPVAYIHTSPDVADSRSMIAEKLSAPDTDPRGAEVAAAILRVLGLKTDPAGKASTIRNLAQKHEEFQIAPVMPQDEQLTNLAKAAQEMELVKKFGKKKVTELAKKMNYHGAVINKSK